MSAEAKAVGRPARVAGAPWIRGARPALTGAWRARGLSLADRVAVAGAVRPAAAASDDLAVRADRRVEVWRDAYPAAGADALGLQSAAYGVDPAYVRDLMAESADGLAARAGKPWWAGEVERIVGELAAPAAVPEPESPRAGDGRAADDGMAA